MCLTETRTSSNIGGRPPVEMIGRVFGRLTVLRQSGVTSYGNKRYAVRCSCGVVKNVNGKNLRQGMTRSCGCLRVELRRKAILELGGFISNSPIESKLRHKWRTMCRQHKKGKHNLRIEYAPWFEFSIFFVDVVGLMPSPDAYKSMALCRIDKTIGYSPKNVEWRDNVQDWSRYNANH